MSHSPTASPEPSTTFIVKVAGACNLNCSYCYMYNLGDTSYRLRPRIMSAAVARRAAERIAGYAQRTDLDVVNLVIHGGEPLLAGKAWLSEFFTQAREAMPVGTQVRFSLQTNGTPLDDEWISLLAREGVSLGISIDGPAEWHDAHRRTLTGRPTYARVRRAIDRLVDAGAQAPRWGVLTVSDPGFSGVEIFRHFVDIGVRRMDFLWPDYHHDMRPPWPSGRLAEYYVDIFDAWYDDGDPAVHVRFFETTIEMLLGADPKIDALGPQPLAEVVIEADGSLEPLDVLRICGDGTTRLGLNVATHDIEDLRGTALFQAGLHSQELLPDECRSCPVLHVCGGGYLPHRWGRGRGFRNPSVHSADLQAVIAHVHARIRGDLEEAGLIAGAAGAA